MEKIDAPAGIQRMSSHVKLVCFYGPESTGKTTMAIQMAEKYKTGFVPEVAREIITSNASFTLDDIIKVGYSQLDRTQEKRKEANRFLFCDSDIITTQIYSKHYLGAVPPVLLQLEKKISYDAYFLFDTDVPWVDDGLRDLGDKREEMFAIFKDELEARQIPYKLVRGGWSEREAFIQQELASLL